jgi:hypothetical protein
MENWTPNYGPKTTFKKKNRYSMEDGDVVFRILPQPKGTNAQRSPQWSEYHSLHFGYKNSEGKSRPFRSTLVKKNKEVVVGDPALERLNELKAKLEQAPPGTPLAAKLQGLVGFQGTYNVDNNHYMNVIGLDGNIGVLKLRYTAKQALDAEIAKLRAAGVDPLSFDNGRFFVFSRSGKFRDTTFTVRPYTEQVDAVTSRQVVHKVTAEILARLETEGFDLTSDEVAFKVTIDEIKQIVDQSDLLTGKSPAVDRIIDARWKAKRASNTNQNSNPTQNDDGPDAPDTLPPTAQLSNAKPTTTANPLGAPLASAVTTPTQAQAAAAPAATQAQAIDEMSDADFWAKMGIKTEASA